MVKPDHKNKIKLSVYIHNKSIELKNKYVKYKLNNVSYISYIRQGLHKRNGYYCTFIKMNRNIIININHKIRGFIYHVYVPLVNTKMS